MKILQRTLCLIVALLVIVHTAAAADAASIRVNRDSSFNGTDQGETYTAFKIFDAAASGSGAGDTTDQSIMDQGYIPLSEPETFDESETYYIRSGDPYTYTVQEVTAETFAELKSGLYKKGTAQPAAGVSYYLDKDSKFAFLAGVDSVGEYLTFTETADGAGYMVAWNNEMESSEENARALAGILGEYVVKDDYGYKVNPKVNNGEYLEADIDYYVLSIDNDRTPVAEGYYMIKSSLGENLALVTTDVTITEKNTYPTITKEFADARAALSQSADDSRHDEVQIGDTVLYTLTVNLPDGANQMITITDIMDAGLDAVVYQNSDSSKTDSYTNESGKVGKVAVTAETLGGEPVTGFRTSAVSNLQGGGHSFTISMDPNQVAAYKGQSIAFTYGAVVNREAALDSSQSNQASLNYGGKYTTNVEEIDTVTHKLTINKNDGSNPLKGAMFELYRDNKEGNAVRLVRLTEEDLAAAGINRAADTVYYRVADTVNEGSAMTSTIDMTDASSAVIYGLDNDSTYLLSETKAPAGYNRLTEDVPVEAGHDGDRTVDVTNLAGSILPSTGGMGTRNFYLAGSALLAGAALLLLARRRIKGEKSLDSIESLS